MLTLYSFWRSGAAHRVRIALELKGVPYQIAPIDLRAGEQRSEAFAARNAQELVPMIEVDGLRLSQSLAIIEWLDDAFPEPPLLPDHPDLRAQVRAAAQMIACDVHPLGNARVLAAVRNLGADDTGVAAWATRWITSGFRGAEQLMTEVGAEGPFAFGPEPGFADCVLAPQLYAAQDRYAFDLAPYPRLAALDRAARAHPAFIAAHPLNQPDAPRS